MQKAALASRHIEEGRSGKLVEPAAHLQYKLCIE